MQCVLKRIFYLDLNLTPWAQLSDMRGQGGLALYLLALLKERLGVKASKVGATQENPPDHCCHTSADKQHAHAQYRAPAFPCSLLCIGCHTLTLCNGVH